MRKFSEIIKELRGDRYSQQGLAEELGISKSTVAMWETDKRLPSTELYEQIADLFNVDTDYLYGRTNIRKARHFDSYGNEYVNATYVKEGAGYYFDDETKQIAQELYNNKDLKMLFDTTRNTKPEDLKLIVEMAKRFKETR